MNDQTQSPVVDPAERTRMCTSKKKFRKENDAITFAVRCQSSGRWGRGARVYKCAFCSGYHVAARG